MSTEQVAADYNNPFMGPDPLSELQPVFGRDDDIAALRSLILAERVVVMHGDSGAGKSSVLKGDGGIRTSFRKERGFSVLGPIDLRVAITDNVKNLYQRTLIEEIIRQNKIDSDKQSIGDELRALYDLELLIMHLAREADSSYQLLIIDQFEDIFSRLPYDEDGRRSFFQMLGGILERNEGLKVLLSMRDEYLGELDRFRRFIPGRLRATFRLELLGKPQAFDAITMTVKREPYNVVLCAEEVKEMVEDLSTLGASDLGGEKLHSWNSHFVEPLFLQLACRHAWPGILARSKKLKPSSDDGKAPCVPMEGSASTEELDAVLSRFYEDTVSTRQAKSTAGNDLKLRMFVQDGLITQNGVRNLISEEEVMLRWGLSGEAINTLVQAHLVRPQRRNRETFYELAHDRLLGPIKSNNEKWINQLPDWRKAARLWDLGGGSDRKLSIVQQIKGRLASRRAPDSLPLYEKRFLAEKASITRRFIAQVFMFATVWAMIGGASSYFANNKVRETIYITKLEVERALQEVEKKETELNDVKLKLEERESDLETKTQDLKTEQDLSKIRGLIEGYIQRKWVESNDEAAILQVREAYDEAERRFGAGKIPTSLTGPFLMAFNNAMTPTMGSPGFSRTFTLDSSQNKPIAIHPGENARIALYDDNLKCLAIRGLEDRSEKVDCVQNGDTLPVPDALDFDPQGHYLAAQSSKGLSIFNVTPPQANKALTPQVFEENQAVDLFNFSTDGTRIGYLSKGSLKVLCLNAEWTVCAKRDMQEDYSKISGIAISYPLNGTRNIAVARKNGDVMLMSFDDSPPAEQVASINQLTIVEEPGRFYPYFKDDRRVLYFSFIGKSQTLFVVHRDTQIVLMRINKNNNQVVKSKVVVRKGISSRPTKAEEGNKHFQAAIVSSDSRLFTVLEDEITQWDLSTINMTGFTGDDIGILPSRPWVTGARNIKALSVNKDWLMARGFFRLWLWERGGNPESKLINAKFPAVNREFQKELLFYPQAISFGPDSKIYVGTTQQGLMRWMKGSKDTWITDNHSVCAGFENIAVRSIALSSDRRMIAMAMARGYGEKQGRLMVLPLSDATRPLLCDKQVHEDGLWAVAFSHDGKWLVSGDYEGKVHLWNITPDGINHHAELPLGNHDPVRSMAFHPKHNLLAIGKWQPKGDKASGAVELVTIGDNGDIQKSRLLHFYKGGIGSILDVGFSNDGGSLVAAGSSGPMQLWRINTIEPLIVETSRILPGHAGGTRTLAFNPKLDYLASGGADELVRVWDLKNADTVSVSANLKGIDADVLSLAWHKDGKQLAVSYKHSSLATKKQTDKQSHGVVALWDWDLSRLSKIVCDTAWRPLNEEEWSNWIEPVSQRPYEVACGLNTVEP